MEELTRRTTNTHTEGRAHSGLAPRLEMTKHDITTGEWLNLVTDKAGTWEGCARSQITYFAVAVYSKPTLEYSA